MSSIFTLNEGTVIKLSSINAVSPIFERKGDETRVTHYYLIHIGSAAKPYLHRLDVSEIYRLGPKPSVLKQRLSEALNEFSQERKHLIAKWVALTNS
jgi:hypothetical protein